MINYTFRFDDICVNTNMENARGIADVLFQSLLGSTIMFAISPCATRFPNGCERVYPKEWNPLSDFRTFYKMDSCGVPFGIPPYVQRANHGLVHVDHRLLSRDVQELSILMGASLSRSTTFVPPFNKWNRDTEAICTEHRLHLVKFEDGWLSMEHNRFDRSKQLWYVHSRAFTPEKVEQWIKDAI